MELRALVFDDNRAIRSLISSVLQERGYEVHAFSEPGACPVFLDRVCPCPVGYTCADIIITDINMPNVTGLEFIENQIKHGCQVSNFAAMSGSWSESEVTRATELGCKIFKKPFDFNEIISWLNHCEKNIDPSRRLWDWFEHKKERGG